MGVGNRRDTRWIIAVLAGALVASAVVVYALVRMTTPSDDGPGLKAAPTSTSGQSTSAATNSSEPGSTPGISNSASDGGSSPPSPGDADTSSEAGTFSATQSVPATTTAELPHSHVILPAAWTGVAKVTISVLGDCAANNSSVYDDLPADLALDLIQNEANAAQAPLPSGAKPDDVTLTLGVNSGGVPSLALYSSQIDEGGTLQRFWTLNVTGDKDRTNIRGILSSQPTDGSTPNMVVDAETSLQPCESVGTVSLPRALANGTTIEGWVTPDSASLTIEGVTTDKKRKVTIEIAAHRGQ
ncbi:MAG: hypothetical protein ABI382_04080 [Nakamurella sp.]